MATFYEIPTIALPHRFSVQLVGVTYKMTLLYQAAQIGPSDISVERDSNLTIDQSQIGGWILDIADVNGVPILAGIPLITGQDLLQQFSYLNFGGSLFVSTDGSDAVPTASNLGTSSHLYFATNP